MPTKPSSEPFKRVIPASRILGAPPPPAEEKPAPPTQAAPKLRRKQEKFVQEVLVDGNAARAAREAGYSPRSAGSIATENMRKPAIQQAIQVFRQTAAEEAGIRNVTVLKLVYQMASADARKLVDPETGHPVPLQQLPDDIAASIIGVDIVPVRFDDAGKPTAYAHRVKLADKNSAAEKLMRHLGMFERDNAQQGGDLATFLREVKAVGNRVPLKP